MLMDRITSRKNAYIMHIRALSGDADYRYTEREFLCDGRKLLTEAMTFGAEITSVLWKENPAELSEILSENGVKQMIAPADLFSYASPMSNSPGPLFTVKIPAQPEQLRLRKAIVLENVQDPGNVGTVIRTANAFGIDAVILTGGCADVYSPKTVRSTMGAIFRQKILRVDREKLKSVLDGSGLKLYGAVLSERASDILKTDVTGCAVAVGSEGQGLSRELREMCDGEIIIPMEPDSESLNAAVAASVIMWEMRGR